MTGIEPLWVVMGIGLAVLVGAGVVGARRRAGRRREAARAVALAMGLEYREELAAPDPAFSGLSLTSRGERRRLRNVLVGTHAGLQVLLGDLHFVQGAGKHRFAREESLCLVRGGSSFDLPHVLVRERVPLFAAVDHEQGIELGVDEAFSRSFAVTAEDERAARKLLTAPARERLMRLVGRWVAIETSGDAVALAYARPISPGELPKLLDQTLELRQVLSPH